MKAVITGVRGQLGFDVVKAFEAAGHVVVPMGREDCDITDLSRVDRCMKEIQPDVIVHCAAYTAVDLAETEVDKAFEVNTDGARNLAVAAEKVGAKLVYVSTDYVFDGKGMGRPYQEYDATNPQGVYGRSKLAGERLIQTLSSKYFIVRTSWVFGSNGNNFVKTMLKFGRERGKLKVVNDQVGSPTYTVDLARFLLDLASTEKYGIYHASNTGICSWYDFAKEIFERSGVKVELTPCTTEEFPRPAPRPAYSAMDHMAIRTNGFALLPPWQDALERFLTEMGEV
ncbi:dTDP-4-dehydrorhamnose reductase [Paenibacillus sp.]|uniref:dTDP-4-dehydrorhamnose reductase n=1 Tax=Paenibacillus sp. TaxID=58172 RepID=UPI002811569B|nr:dTDP-4-dehydrorhamnose reductase [Paenibacillus sp.]